MKRRGVAEVHTHRIEIRGVCMDTDRHEVTVCGEIVELTNREFELLRTLMENKDIVMDREKLLSAVLRIRLPWRDKHHRCVCEVSENKDR